MNNVTQILSAIEAGDPTRTVVEIADQDGYDLIVMGTHGRTGLSHLVLGSVAEQVVRRAKCPVLTVRGSDDESDEDSSD